MSVLDSTGGSSTGLFGKQLSPEGLGYDAAIILIPKGDSLATKTLALVKANWLNEINEVDTSRWRVLPIFNDISANKEEDVYNTSSIGMQTFIREGKTSMTYKVLVTPIVKKQLRTLNGISWDVFILTSNGFVKGTSSDGTKFEGFSTSVLHVGAEEPAAADVEALTPITVTYSDPKELNDFPAFIEPLREGTPDVWNVKDLEDPKAVKATIIGSPTATGLVMDIAGYDGVALTGVVVSDVSLLDSTDTEHTVTTCTESATITGRYTLVIPTMSGDYRVGLKAVGLTATQGYNTLVADLAEFTV